MNFVKGNLVVETVKDLEAKNSPAEQILKDMGVGN